MISEINVAEAFSLMSIEAQMEVDLRKARSGARVARWMDPRGEEKQEAAGLRAQEESR